MKSNRLNRFLKGAVKSFSLFTILFSLALASCSKEAAEELAPQTESTTFTLSVDELQTPAQAKAATRAAIAPTRYVMEVWSEDGLTAENVFENGTTNHAQITTGNSFTVTLDKTKAYTCLFWADNTTTFNATSLKAIGLNSGKDMAEAYYAKVDVAKGKNPAVDVTLTRAVAKITFTETATVKTTDNLALKFSNIFPQFSVLDGAATGTAAEWTKTIQPTAESGLIGTLYFFAKSAQELTELTFKYANEAEKTVSNIPYQMNYATNIKGEYSNLMSATFTVTADEEWYTPENEVNFGTKVYKVGDIYPDATAPTGVVFWIDETDASYNSTDKTSAKGKIVSLNEGEGRWGASSKDESIDVTGIRSADDGATATKNLITARLSSSSFATDYYAFNWIYATKNGNKVDGGWYMPAKNELLALYAAWNGSSSTTADNTARDTFNAKLTAASGEEISSTNYYWSSTEGNSNTAWYVYFDDGGTGNSGKNGNGRVRAVLAF